MQLSLQSTAFSDTLVILGAAGLVIPAFTRLKISPVIGFILVGLIAGPYGLGSLVDQIPWLYHITISDPEAIEPFAEFGIVLLLFSIGLELSFKRLWTMRRMVFGLGLGQLLLSAALLGIAVRLLGQPWEGALAIGIALALSSTAIALPLAGTVSAVGKRAFSMLLLEDLALVPIIFALGALAPYGGQAGFSDIAGTLLKGSITIAVMLLAGRLLLPRLFGQAARTKSPELFLAASLLVVILASIATSSVGLSPIVGALIAGILIAETDYRSEVELITAPFRGLALGVFLITVGMGLDLPRILDNWREFLLALAGVALIKTLVTVAVLRLGKTRHGVAWETGLLMASPSETTLIILGAALQARLIQPETAHFWQIVTAMGLTLTPLLAKLGTIVSRRIDRDAHAHLADDILAGDTRRTVIIGFGRVGRMVALMLGRHDQPYVAIDADPDAVTRGRKRGFNVRFGDITRPGMIERLKLDKAAALVLTMDDPAQLARMVTRVRKSHPDLTIVARARDPDQAADLYRAGVTDAVPDTLESSLQLSEAVLVDLGVAMGPVIASIHEKRAELRTRIMRLSQMDRMPRSWLRGRDTV